MPILPSTEKQIASLSVLKRAEFWDQKIPELLLRVEPSGRKMWMLRYRVKGGVRRRLRLGRYPDVSLGEARDKARGRIKVLWDGRDPADVPRVESPAKAFTFSSFVPVYTQFAKGQKATWRSDLRKIEKHVLPYWRDKPLRDITRADVHEVLDRTVATGLTTGVNRLQAVVSRMFTVALDRSLMEAHPATRLLKRHKEQARDRVLSDEELRALWMALEKRFGRAADAVKLRMLLGQRIEHEIMPMEWHEVDFASGVWTIPRERTKNRKQPHVVPFGHTTRRILWARRSMLPDDQMRVFPGLSGSSQDYRELSALRAGFAWIDLRRTLATRLAGLGYSETTIGRVLNHAKVTVTARHYNQHAYDTEKRQALEAWDRELMRVVQSLPRLPAVVVPLR